MWVEVRDDGAGFTEGDVGKGHGLELVRERLPEGAALELSRQGTGMVAGMVVRLRLPAAVRGMMRAFLLDDEALAVKRLRRMLEETGQVEIAGTATDPVDALALVRAAQPEVLFLDIQMPGLTGFEFLERLSALGAAEPLVVFTTAFNEYALRAFEVNSVDYLVKPVAAEQLARALRKVERVLGSGAPREPLQALVAQLSAALQKKEPAYPVRISSKLGDKVELIELARVSHFYAEDKLTFAAAGGRQHILDLTIAELEERLDPAAICARAPFDDGESRLRAGAVSVFRGQDAGAVEG